MAVFTSSLQPKIIEDYSALDASQVALRSLSGHVFQGVHKEAQMLKVLDGFRQQLHRVSHEIQQRNEKRIHDPDMGDWPRLALKPS